ncbi:MAG: hypothetical protein EOO15_13265 [Chitinophagaceae bacterium]|nr:MAG: hypothetical protein EOO15_13265 [Chitinophagaceae bacterium]
MPIAWLFNAETSTDTAPRISGQLLSLSSEILVLRNPWVTDSIFMGKLYTAVIITTVFFTYPYLYETDVNYDLEGAYLFAGLLISTPFIFAPFLAYRVYLIRSFSKIYFNRITRKIYYRKLQTTFTLDWSSVEGGLFQRTEFGGSSFTTSYALAFSPRSEDDLGNRKDYLWVDSNEPNDPSVKHVAEVWEYLRHFMDHGPETLPVPTEPDWWHRPIHQVALPPVEAWRHYAPWRTGEAGEMQGKRNWQLPFWAILFPYNLTVALCWYYLCQLFDIREAPAPAGAFVKAPCQTSEEDDQ